MPIPTISYLDEQGVLDPSCKDVIPPDELIRGYKTMVLTRQIDDRMITLQRQGLITFALSSLGEEACSVASAAALSIKDWIYPQYREAGVMFWRGFTAQQYIHHMFGDREDISLGRQMPNHFGARELNVVHVSSPVGTQIPQAAGCAYAMKIQNEPTVAICYFGEGTASEGDFHSGLNFAAVRQAPVIFFCRNNGYAISTPCSRQFATDGIAPRGIGYGIETYRVDGNDYFAIHQTVTKAKQHCLDDKGPVLIEAMTFRMGAHSTSDDPSAYRKDEEVEKWKEKDPILRLRRYLEKQSLWDAKKEDQLNAEITEEINQAIAKAKETEKPKLDLLIEHVYEKVPDSLKEQYQELKDELCP